MKPLIVNQSNDTVPKAWLERWVRGLARVLPKKARKELVLVFVDSGEMKRMNAQYRGKKYATDVLSFESADEDCTGELVLCLPVIRAQAKSTGLGERGELGYMIVHGVLHLLGYDHETSRADEAKMFALQDKIYSKLEKSVGLR